MTKPIRAAESSANTARSVGSEVTSTYSIRSRCTDSASGLAWRTDCRNEIPSRTNDTASTTYPTAKWLGRLRVNELVDAVRDRHRGAGHKQPDRGEQRPHVRLPAMAERMRGVRRAAGPPFGDQQEDLLPVSAHECAASATSDADPVTVAATDFATATSALAPNATSTVVRLSDAPGSRSRDTDPNRS